MKNTFHSTLMPALDALIGSPEILSPEKETKKKSDILVIPGDFIRRASEIRGEVSSRGDACAEILKSFNTILRDIHYEGKHIAENGMEIRFEDDKNDHRMDESSKQSVLRAAKKYTSEHKGESFAILTGDNAMSSMAYNAGFDVAHINPHTYSGRRRLVLPVDYYTQWEKNGYFTAEQLAEMYSDESPLNLNEFVEFIASKDVPLNSKSFYRYIGRFEPDDSEYGATLRRIHYLNDAPPQVKPRNAGQAILLEALFAPSSELPIVICDGPYGTGKTFLTVVAAYAQTAMTSRYDSIFVVPSEGSIGKDLGALPGDKNKKISPLTAPIQDNLYSLFKILKNKEKGGQNGTPKTWRMQAQKAFEEYIELEALSYIGGRSISDCFYIIDETQALERHQIKQLTTRVSDGSKLVCIGDRHQTYNPHMNADSNGLAYAASKLGGSRYAAVITLYPHEIVRSAAVIEIAKRIG